MLEIYLTALVAWLLTVIVLLAIYWLWNWSNPDD